MARRATAELHGGDDLKRAFASLGTLVKKEVQAINTETLDTIRKEARQRIPLGPGRYGHTRDKFRRFLAKDGLSGGVFNKDFRFRFRELGTKRQPARPTLFAVFELMKPRYLARLRAAIYGITRAVR